MRTQRWAAGSLESVFPMQGRGPPLLRRGTPACTSSAPTLPSAQRGPRAVSSGPAAFPGGRQCFLLGPSAQPPSQDTQDYLAPHLGCSRASRDFILRVPPPFSQVPVQQPLLEQRPRFGIGTPPRSVGVQGERVNRNLKNNFPSCKKGKDTPPFLLEHFL